MPIFRRLIEFFQPAQASDPLSRFATDLDVSAQPAVPLDEHVHFDVRRIMQETINSRPQYQHLRYKESLVPNKSALTGEGLGAINPGFWGIILEAIAANIRLAQRARPEAVKAYKALQVTASEHESTFAKDLGSTRKLLAARILKAVPKNVA